MADQQTTDGRLDGLSLAAIDRKTGIKGFGLAVAKARWLKMTPGGWLVRGALINNLDNPYRNQVQALAESGNIGMSIGFEIMDSSAPTNEERKSYAGASNMIRAWKLLEVSYTAMPMNGDCQSDMVPVVEEPKSMRRVIIL